MKWGRLHVAAAVLGISAPGVAASAQPAFAGLEGLYIIGCGHSIEPDGSVIIYAIPGHTPGQVLLVRLAKFDSVMLSGDAVRFRYSLEKRHIPSNNVDREQPSRRTSASSSCLRNTRRSSGPTTTRTRMPGSGSRRSITNRPRVRRDAAMERQNAQRCCACSPVGGMS
jgi:hypothetical protein